MNELQRLEDHRNAILLAEVGAWLHLIWKADWRWVRRQSEGGGKEEYGRAVFVNELLMSGYPKLSALLDYRSTAYAEPLNSLPIGDDNKAPASLGVFVRDHRKAGEAKAEKLDHLTTLMHEGHGRGSHIDKADVAGSGKKLKLGSAEMATAFGYENSRTAGDYRTEGLKSELERWVPDVDAALKSKDAEDWHKALRRLRALIKTFGSEALADTRVPFHDVTLFDQTSSAVAFFKAALSERVVAGGWKALRGADGLPAYFWRSLSIGIDGLEYLGSARGIGDLLGRKQKLDAAQNAVAKILEVDYPIGTEIYRDENQTVFIVPDEGRLLQWSDGDSILQERIQTAFAMTTDGELRPYLDRSLLEGGTRTVYSVAKHLSAEQGPNCADAKGIADAWPGDTRAELCSSCLLRPQIRHGRAAARKLCRSCLNSRVRRAREWWESGQGSTVWIDEAADEHGRIALVVGRWELDPWLDGTAWTSVVAAPDRDFAALELECGKAKEFSSLLGSVIHPDTQSEYQTFERYFDGVIAPEWEQWEAKIDRGTLAAIHLVRQNPSFARMRRSWETTRKFWQEILPTDVEGTLAKSDLGARIGETKYKRVAIRGEVVPEDQVENELVPFQAYELHLGNSKLSVVWVPDGMFVSADNLEVVEREAKEKVSALLEKKTLVIMEPTGYGSPNKEFGTLRVSGVEELRRFEPVIPILAEPRHFLAVVPASEGLKAVACIQEKYQKEMGKVRNRLSMQIGIVYAEKRTPLRAVVDAGRRMLRRRGRTEEWVVAQVPATRFGDESSYSIRLEREGRQVTWNVPAGLSGMDGGDKWYPYVFLAGAKREAALGNGKNRKGVWDQKVLEMVHVSDLGGGDRIWFTPATFDFEWLDTAGRRFEVAYGADGGRRGRTTRPYLLDEAPMIDGIWERLAKLATGLTNSQINALDQTIETKRDEWQARPEDEQFRRFCRDTLINADWGTDLGQELDTWTEHAVTGRLHDVVELFMKVMKRRSNRGPEEGKA